MKDVEKFKDEPTTMRDFAVGKHVKIRDRKYGHKFKIGQVVKLIHYDDLSMDWTCRSAEGEWSIREEEATVCEFDETVETNYLPKGYSKDQLIELVRFTSAEVFDSVGLEFMSIPLSFEDSESIVDDFLQSQE